MLLGFILASSYLIFAACGALIALLLAHSGYDPSSAAGVAWASFLLLTLVFGIVPVQMAQRKLTA